MTKDTHDEGLDPKVSEAMVDRALQQWFGPEFGIHPPRHRSMMRAVLETAVTAIPSIASEAAGPSDHAGLVDALKEANAFILAPAEDLKEGVLSRLREAIAALSRAPEAVAFENGPVKSGFDVGRFLGWIADRLEHVHGENPNYDYMHRLREIAATPPAPQKASEMDSTKALIERAFNDPVEFRPTGWRESEPALRMPNAAEAKARILAALSHAPAADGDLLDQAVAFAEMWGTEQNWPHVRDAYVAAILRERATPAAPQPALALIEELERALKTALQWADGEYVSFKWRAGADAALASAKRFKELSTKEK